MLYTEYVNRLGMMLPAIVTTPSSATPFADARMNTALPQSIEYAELTMLRDPDLDFLAAKATVTATATAATPTISKPASVIVSESESYITPAGSAPDAVGSTRNPLRRLAPDTLRMMWPGAAMTGAPVYIGQRDDSTFVLGPPPDLGYVVEFYGTTRPTALSSSNASNFLTVNLPDLYFAAAMIFWVGVQKQYSIVPAEQQGEPYWFSVYKAAKHGAAVEEARKKHQSSGWTGVAPTTVATPPRA